MEVDKLYGDCPRSHTISVKHSIRQELRKGHVQIVSDSDLNTVDE
jgi:hypothetical protein